MMTTATLEKPAARTLQIPTESLVAALRFVRPAISPEETRYYLRSVLFDLDSVSGLRIVATDGHRMHVWRFPELRGPDARFLLKSEHMGAILRTLHTKRAQRANDCVIDFAAGVLSVGTKTYADWQSEATYPDWQRVVPRGCEHAFSMAHDDFTGIIDAAAAVGAPLRFAADPSDMSLRLTARHTHVAGKGTSNARRVTMESHIDKALVRTKTDVGFSAALVRDIIRSFGRVLLDVCVDGSSSPSVWRAASTADDRFVILMPMRI
jgi:DNA polymerase-3 subunit beta